MSNPLDHPTSVLFVDATNFDRRVYNAYRRTDVDLSKLFAQLTADTWLLGVKYFYSMLIQHEDRERYAAQRRSIAVLHKLTNVVFYEGQHRRRQTQCPRCKCEYHYFAEKGTDVNLSAQLIHAACKKIARRFIVVTSDNDFAPAIKLARAEGIEVDVGFVSDPNEKEYTQLLKVDALRRTARRYIQIDQEMLSRCWESPKSVSKIRLTFSGF